MEIFAPPIEILTNFNLNFGQFIKKIERYRMECFKDTDFKKTKHAHAHHVIRPFLFYFTPILSIPNAGYLIHPVLTQQLTLILTHSGADYRLLYVKVMISQGSIVKNIVEY